MNILTLFKESAKNINFLKENFNQLKFINVNYSEMTFCTHKKRNYLIFDEISVSDS